MLVSDKLYLSDTKLKHALTNITLPIYKTAHAINSSIFNIQLYWKDQTALINEHKLLKQKLLKNSLLVAMWDGVAANTLELENLFQNENIIKLLNNDYSYNIAYVSGHDKNHSRHISTLNKGNADGIAVGDIVMHEYGIYGQIIFANSYSSRVLLLSDMEHYTPVKIVRTGQLVLAKGNGSQELQIQYAPSNSDIQQDDIVITSGLGNVYPHGIKIGFVNKVTTDLSKTFIAASIKTHIHYKKHQPLAVINFNQQ